jgi:hypothetical protein
MAITAVSYPTITGARNSALNLSANTVVKAGPGTVGKVSVNTAGAEGTLHDCLTAGAANAGNLVAQIPATVGVLDINMPFKVGIVYLPGAAQVASINFQ